MKKARILLGVYYLLMFPIHSVHSKKKPQEWVLIKNQPKLIVKKNNRKMCKAKQNCMKKKTMLVTAGPVFYVILTFDIYFMPNPLYIRGAYDKFPDFFGMGI